MTELEIVKWIVFGLMGVAVWFMKRTIDNIEDKQTSLDKDIAEIRKDYLHRDDFKEFKLELRAMFDEIKSDIKELKHKQ